MSRFPTTQWSLIELAHLEAPTGSREQMGDLLKAYWQPMYAHLRYKGLSHEAAEDLTQGFMIEILNKDLLSIADPKRGKFRTLLLTALDRYAVSQRRYEKAAKRSPGKIASLEAIETDSTLAPDPSPSAAFERAWALDVLAQAMARMKQECENTGQSARWTVFERRILAPLLDDAPVPDYAELTQELGLENDKATMNLLVTAKRQFARLLRDQIRVYITLDADRSPQEKGMASRLKGAATNEETAQRVARQLAEQFVARAVEDEINQLKKALAQNWSPGARELESGHESIPYKSDFWQRLVKRPGSGEPLDRLYDWDQDAAAQVPIEVLFQSILDGNLSEIVGNFPGTLRICLCDEEPSLEALEAVKEWASVQRASGSESLPGNAASAIYFGAIAAALLRCRKKITGLNGHALTSGLQWVVAQDWVDPGVRSTANAALSCVES